MVCNSSATLGTLKTSDFDEFWEKKYLKERSVLDIREYFLNVFSPKIRKIWRFT